MCIITGVITGLVVGLTLLMCQLYIDTKRKKEQCEKELTLFVENVRSFINEMDDPLTDYNRFSAPVAAQKLIEAIRSVPLDIWNKNLSNNRIIDLTIKVRRCYYTFDEFGTLLHQELNAFYSDVYQCLLEKGESPKDNMHYFVRSNISFFIGVTLGNRDAELLRCSNEDCSLEHYRTYYAQAHDSGNITAYSDLYLDARQKLHDALKQLSIEVHLKE